MRWLFTLLIALFCWSASVSGQKLCAAHTQVTPITLNQQVSPAEAVFVPYRQVYRPQHIELRRKAPGKQLLSLPRVHSYLSTLFSPDQQVPAYTLTTVRGYSTKPLRYADSPAPNRLPQVNWTLRSSAQQSRLGGWKESNTLYRGSLIYHL